MILRLKPVPQLSARLAQLTKARCIFFYCGTNCLQCTREVLFGRQDSPPGWAHWGIPQDLFVLKHFNPESILFFFEAFGSLFPLE